MHPKLLVTTTYLRGDKVKRTLLYKNNGTSTVHIVGRPIFIQVVGRFLFYDVGRYRAITYIKANYVATEITEIGSYWRSQKIIEYVLVLYSIIHRNSK